LAAPGQTDSLSGRQPLLYDDPTASSQLTSSSHGWQSFSSSFFFVSRFKKKGTHLQDETSIPYSFGHCETALVFKHYETALLLAASVTRFTFAYRFLCQCGRVQGDEHVSKGKYSSLFAAG
jgi:hypothetical protein